MVGAIWIVWMALAVGIMRIGWLLHNGRISAGAYVNWYFILFPLWMIAMVAFVICGVCEFSVLLFTPWI
jgi:hypothetical protein